MRRFLALAFVAMAALNPAHAQTVAAGASPGRASYRPDVQWNDGPFYTTSHWNPYAPHLNYFNGLTTTDVTGLPYGAFARSDFSAFRPGTSTLYSYDQGFTPYAGYAEWYKKTYDVTPTRPMVANADNRFFRSAPRLGGVQPLESYPIFAPARGTAPALPGPVREMSSPGVARAKVIQQAGLAAHPRTRGPAIYRSIPTR
jgi:hypothetical protein